MKYSTTVPQNIDPREWRREMRVLYETVHEEFGLRAEIRESKHDKWDYALFILHTDCGFIMVTQQGNDYDNLFAKATDIVTYFPDFFSK